MNQDHDTSLPCVCAANAPNETNCDKESFGIAKSADAARKRSNRRMSAFNARPTPANALRARAACIDLLSESEVVLRRTRACLEFTDGVDATEERIAFCVAEIDNIDRMLAEHESEAKPERRPPDQRQQQQHRAAARTGIRVTRRMMRWLSRQ